MRFGLDIDGVVYKWSDTARYLLNNEFGYSLGESTHWNYIKDNVSTAHWRWLWEEGVTERGLFRYGHIYQGTIEALRELETMADIVAITVRPKSAIRDTLDWLSFMNIPTEEVHILTDANRKKSDIKPHCDIYLDDSETNFVDYMTNTQATVLLQSRPWNQHVSIDYLDHRGRRVDGWYDVLTVVRNRHEGLG